MLLENVLKEYLYHCQLRKLSKRKMIMERINKMLIELYATMAQDEIEKKEKRQQEGIEAKKARGEWADYGRPKAEKPSN